MTAGARQSRARRRRVWRAGVAGLAIGLALLLPLSSAVAGQRARRLRSTMAPLPPTWTSGAIPGAVSGPAGTPVGALWHKVPVPEAGKGYTCLRQLRRLGIPHRRIKPQRGVPTPVLITGPVAGLTLEPLWRGRKPILNCRFAVGMYTIARVARRLGFNKFRFSSSYRRGARVAGSGSRSRHASAMAIDVQEFHGPGGLKVNVLKDWQKLRGGPGRCVGPVKTRKARLLRQLACALERSGAVRLVLTPDSDYAHRDHFHIAGLRPGERPLKNRYAGRTVRRRRR